MESAPNVCEIGPFEARYFAFLGTITQLRPQLHKYCARMTGSVMDGEDVVQETLFEAYRKLDKFDESRPLKPWLFRIAHNRCIDFLRHQNVRGEAEANISAPIFAPATESASADVRPAIEHLVSLLPPKERACVLLKDVFDYSLKEIAELVDSSVVGVKAALKRGRTKLEAAPALTRSSRETSPEMMRILRLYIERFNRRDWDGVRELISADAQLRVVDAFAGKLADSPYFSNYGRLSIPWRLVLGFVDGQPLAVRLRRDADTWSPYSFIRIHVTAQQIDRIVDYSHCPWITSIAEPDFVPEAG